jgi:L,D-transpeptidase catalytic domain
MKKIFSLLVGLALSAVLLGAAEPASAASCSTGPYQSYAEKYLKLTVNGTASQNDCDKIAAFQRDNGIKPAAGYAGPTTYKVMKRKTAARARAGNCPAYNRVVCVDMTNQMMWISENGERVWGPYAARTGRNGYETRVTQNRGGYCPSWKSTGTLDYCKVYHRNMNAWSTIWDVPMKYAMFFDGGQAFHVSTRYIYDEPGSGGCVHILPNKADYLWNTMQNGTKVYVFGRKPGT